MTCSEAAALRCRQTKTPTFDGSYLLDYMIHCSRQVEATPTSPSVGGWRELLRYGACAVNHRLAAHLTDAQVR